MATTAEYGLGEFTYPRGWFMVAEASELTDKPLSVRFFGRDLVIYRGKASGKVIMLDAYCPHMGTHLAKNTTSYVIHDGTHMEEDSIRCPYHGWRFGADGKCNQIPYYDGPIPKAAAIKSWTVVESIGCVWAWHDPENGTPEWEAPYLSEWDDPAWVHWKIDHLGELAMHGQEAVDNIADCSHLNPVHGATVEYFECEFKGHLAIQRQGGGHRTLVTDKILETDTIYHGPAVLLSKMTGLYDSYILIVHTPVDDGVIKAWHALLVKSDKPVATEADVPVARAYQEMSRLAFAQDFEVWANKRPCFQVMQVPSDGPFGLARIWYKQFYNPRAKREEFLKRVEGLHGAKGMAPAPQKAANA